MAAAGSSSEEVAEFQMHPAQQLTLLESFIGGFMRVMSHAEFRYEGICFYLDLQLKILGLTDVKIYRSEGRKNDNGEILPVETDYDTVLLRGSLIKELQIISQQDIPGKSTFSPDDHFIIEYANTTHLPTSSTISQAADIMSDILSRLCALLQGISNNKSESLWSARFWAPLPPSSSSSSSPAPSLNDLDALGPTTFLPGLEKSLRIIRRPLDKKEGLAASEKEKKKSLLGPCPKLYISAIQSLESSTASERQRTREQPQSVSENEKDDALDSITVDSGVERGEIMPSEETRTTTDELGAYPRCLSGHGSQWSSRRGRGAVGSYYRGGRSNISHASRGRGRVYWAPKDK